MSVLFLVILSCVNFVFRVWIFMVEWFLWDNVEDFCCWGWLLFWVGVVELFICCVLLMMLLEWGELYIGLVFVMVEGDVGCFLLILFLVVVVCGWVFFKLCGRFIIFLIGICVWKCVGMCGLFCLGCWFFIVFLVVFFSLLLFVCLFFWC